MSETGALSLKAANSCWGPGGRGHAGYNKNARHHYPSFRSGGISLVDANTSMITFGTWGHALSRLPECNCSHID
jgi:hypothetical protein